MEGTKDESQSMNDEQERNELVRRLRQRASGEHTQSFQEPAHTRLHAHTFSSAGDPDLTLAADMIEQFGAFIADVKKHGLRCDMHPTMRFDNKAETMYTQLTRYFARSEGYLKERAGEVLAGVEYP